MAKQPEPKLLASLQIIENYPDLHMGPTVPFVLGALQEPIGTAPPSEHSGRDKLRQLLLELSTASAGHGVRIQWCRDIGAHIATNIPFVDGLEWEVDGADPRDLVSLVDALWASYGDVILAGEYSIEHREWRRFTADEILAIEVTLGRRRKAGGAGDVDELERRMT
jgi:hypothetical protein